MLIKVRIEGIEVFPSQVKGKLALERNIVLIIKTQTRVLYVDYVGSNSTLGAYVPPPFLSGKMYYYKLISVPAGMEKYVECIAKEVENRLNPLFKNKGLKCEEPLTVLVEAGE